VNFDDSLVGGKAGAGNRMMNPADHLPVCFIITKDKTVPTREGITKKESWCKKELMHEYR
jgi:hypothetical protein